MSLRRRALVGLLAGLVLGGCALPPMGPEEAAQRLKTRAEQGDVQAQATLSGYYTYGAGGLGIKPDLAKAEKWAMRAAENGDTSALTGLALAYEAGSEYVPRDSKRAFTLYLQAASMGNVGAQSEVGRMYLEGEGTKKDKVEARKWLEKAAKSGNKSAAEMLQILDLE